MPTSDFLIVCFWECMKFKSKFELWVKAKNVTFLLTKVKIFKYEALIAEFGNLFISGEKLF